MANEQLNAGEIFQVLGTRARAAASFLASASTEAKNSVLSRLADLLAAEKEALFKANAEDVARAEKEGLSSAFIDRLRVTDKTVAQMVEGLKQIIALEDPVGCITDMKPRPSGIQIGKMRVPLGVIGIIFESRPNVTIDAAALCLKSGNASILRGGSDARQSNALLGTLVERALREEGFNPYCVQVISNPDRSLVHELITRPEYVDVLIPRGGKSLIERLTREARVPLIKHLDGICHTYAEKSCDQQLALKVIDNAKTQRPSPCNATETLLIDREIAPALLPALYSLWEVKGVEMRCDPECLAILSAHKASPLLKAATEEDWATEYNALIISIRIVSGISEAIAHINRYGSHHTDAILTENLQAADRFLREVDSASVMVNTSTRFADGFEYGLGAEIGISTDKLHARGPVGLEGLTSQKYTVLGHGEIRR
jgi:glutamate-5-semialdehyde dehydrogenase